MCKFAKLELLEMVQTKGKKRSRRVGVHNGKRKHMRQISHDREYFQLYLLLKVNVQEVFLVISHKNMASKSAGTMCGAMRAALL